LIASLDLLISSLRLGGAERMCTVIANLFAERGYSVRVVVLDDGDGPLRADLAKNVPVLALGVRRARYAVPPLYRFLRQSAAPQVLVFNHQLLAMLLCLRPIARSKTRFVLRNISTLSEKLAAERSLWHGRVVHGLARYTIARADHVIAQSEGMALDLVANYAVPEENITVVNNAVSPQMLLKRGDKIHKRRGYEVVFVGRLHAVKDLSLLLNAFVRLKSVLPSAFLSIYGDGPERDALVSQVTKLGLEASVFFHGQVANVADCYTRANVTVLTSLYEGFPNCLIESITIGTPIVSVNCRSGPSEIIRPGRNGYIVQTRHPQDFADALLLASRTHWDPETVRATSTKFKPDFVFRKYEQILFPDRNSVQ
jgi:glycosyltransferase involved in cell wall biosynthesis